MERNELFMELKEFASMINGRERGNELKGKEEALAKELGYVIVFGYSDDVAILRGAINDEVGSYGGSSIYINKDGIFEECDCKCKYSLIAKSKCKEIKAIWGEEYSWRYETSIPHSKFEIFEDGEKYCEGIIFDIKSLN